MKQQRTIVKGIIIFLAAISFALAGCGDDDNNSSTDDNSGDLSDLLEGAYALFTFTNDEYNQENNVNFDGAGSLSSTIIYDSSGDTGEFSGSYAVETTGETKIDSTDSVGIVAADGGSFSLIDSISSGGVDGELMLGFGIKAASGMADADLNGDFVFCQIRYNTSTSVAAASYFEFTMNGDGSWAGDTTYDSDGIDGTALSGDYSVSEDGGVAVTIEGANKDLQGNISANGNLLVLIDEETPNDDEILLMVGLKKTSGADNSLLSGDYQINALGMDKTGGGAWASRINASADGAGTIDVDIIADSNEDTGQQSVEYTTDANGEMTITTTGEHGIVSSDGEILIFVDTAEGDDTDVMMAIGIKKS
jgi:hypothetical protein